jgi:flagellar basal body-associated protein FliL
VALKPTQKSTSTEYFCQILEITVVMVNIKPSNLAGAISTLVSAAHLTTHMPHKEFVLAYYNSPLGCLIDTRKALGILLVHELHDPRLRVFLGKWIAVLVLLLSAGLCGFNLMPIFLTLVLFSVAIALCALFFWFGSEDLFLEFALEDEEFYNLATQSRALTPFSNTDSPQSQPTNKASVGDRAMSLPNFESALTPQERLRTVHRALLSPLVTTIHNRRHAFRSPKPTSNLTKRKR